MDELDFSDITGFTISEPSMKETSCIVCEETFTHPVKRGRQPKLCSSKECRSAHRKATRKPAEKKTRRQKCAGCETIIVKEGRGRIKWCDECRAKINIERHRKYRQETYIAKERDIGNCQDCGCDLGKRIGKGRLKTRCEACQKEQRKEVARLSALKCYKPVVREYTCSVCNTVNQQEGRGKLRKRCPDCIGNAFTMTPQGLAVTVTSNETSEAEEMLKGIFDEG